MLFAKNKCKKIRVRLMRYKEISENKWLDLKKNEIFSTKYYKGIDGKKFSFLDKKDNYLNGQFGLSWYNNFYNRMNLKTSKYISDSEIIIKHHKNKIKGKKVLILGAGPSSALVNWSDDYELIITSNNYYKKFQKPPYMITFTPYINLLSDEVTNFLNNNTSLIGLETEFLKENEIKMVSEFYRKYRDRIVVYQTRYCSAIGVSTRQAVLAVLLGASEVHLCGLDLFKDNNSTLHCFEKNKGLPNWRRVHGKDFQDRQVISFWSYIKQLARKTNCKVVNISEHLECNCMSFITKVKK